MGVVINTAEVEEGAIVAIFGLGGIGLSAIMADQIKGGKRIIYYIFKNITSFC